MLKSIADSCRCQEDLQVCITSEEGGRAEGWALSKVQDPRSPTEPKSQGLVTRRQAGKEKPSLDSRSQHESDEQLVHFL